MVLLESRTGVAVNFSHHVSFILTLIHWWIKVMELCHQLELRRGQHKGDWL
uniref:Uncharacterized protein n=1 Tax=Rhizophora mucronata TaxID=61149 RepID=A0A2P2Q5M1_RHIMU